MLCISRIDWQSIFLKLSDGQVIKLKVIRVNGNQTCSGIDVPSDVFIVREELLVDSENAEICNLVFRS